MSSAELHGCVAVSQRSTLGCLIAEETKFKENGAGARDLRSEATLYSGYKEQYDRVMR